MKPSHTKLLARNEVVKNQEISSFRAHLKFNGEEDVGGVSAFGNSGTSERKSWLTGEEKSNYNC